MVLFLAPTAAFSETSNLRFDAETAIAIAHKYNGQAGRYLNCNISVGGLDFSDMAEVAWILNQEQMHNAEVFFITFGQ